MVTGRLYLGILLSLNTVLFWGVLPIAQKILLKEMDAYTITWYRFLVASLLLCLSLAYKKSLPKLSLLDKKTVFLLVVSTLGLAGNFILYLLGLRLISPAHTQVLIQLAPIFFGIGAMFFFKERFNFYQWLGFLIVLIGLVLFFNEKLTEMFSTDKDYFSGVFLVVLAAVTWATYALAQKKLLSTFSSQKIMFLIYFGCFLVFTPTTSPLQIQKLDSLHLWLLIFCSLNTIFAYGTFAEALVHIEATKVSSILALTPIMTIICLTLTTQFFPELLQVEKITLPGISGAVLVVLGSVTISLTKTVALAKTTV
ncbi:DMT family transporter [bacterium]|nr:DMT family transporter [bacterium]